MTETTTATERNLKHDKTGIHRAGDAQVMVYAHGTSGGERYGIVYVQPTSGLGPKASVGATYGGQVSLGASDEVLRAVWLALGEHLGVRVDRAAVVDIIKRLPPRGHKADAEAVRVALREAIGEAA